MLNEKEIELPPNFKQCSLKGRSFTPSLDLGIHNVQGINVWANSAPRGWNAQKSVVKAAPPTLSVCPATPSTELLTNNSCSTTTQISSSSSSFTQQQTSVSCNQQEQQIVEEQQLKQQQEQQQMMEMQRLEQLKIEEEQQRVQEEQQKMLEEQQRMEQQKMLEEQQRMEQQRLLEEQQRMEQQRIMEEQQRMEQQRLAEEQQRMEQQRILEEQQRMEQQRILEEQQRMEQQRIMEEQQRMEQQRLEQQKIEQQRIEQQRIEQQKMEQQRMEQQRMEQQRMEEERRMAGMEMSQMSSSSMKQESFSQQQTSSSTAVYEGTQFSSGVMGYTQKTEEVNGGAVGFEQQQQMPTAANSHDKFMKDTGIFGGITGDHNSLVEDDVEFDYKKHTVRDLVGHFSKVKPKAEIPVHYLPEQRLYNGEQGPSLNYLSTKSETSFSSTQSSTMVKTSSGAANRQGIDASMQEYEQRKQQEISQTDSSSTTAASTQQQQQQQAVATNSEMSQQQLSERRQSLKEYLLIEPSSLGSTNAGLLDPSAILRGSGDMEETRSKSEGLLTQANVQGGADLSSGKWDNHNSIARGWAGAKANYHPVTFRSIYNVDSQKPIANN